MYVEVLFDWPSDAGSIPAVSTGLDAIGKLAGGVFIFKSKNCLQIFSC